MGQFQTWLPLSDRISNPFSLLILLPFLWLAYPDTLITDLQAPGGAYNCRRLHIWMKLPKPLLPPPASYPFFYGWVIVAAATIGTIMSIPGQTMGVSAFTDHLIKDPAIALGREELALAYLLGTLASAVLLPVAGYFFDRFGARRMIVIASPCMGLTLWFLSSTREVISAITGTQSSLPPGAEKAGVAFLVLSCGFLLVRFWGQGVLTMVSRAMLGKWFRERRGIASGISGIFVSASFAGAPRFLSWMISDLGLGWSGTWKWLGVSNLGLLLIGWLFYRDNPEECGLQTDGKIHPAEGAAEQRDTAGEYSATPGEALRTRAFWIPNLSLALWGLALTGLTFHIVDIGKKASLSEEETLNLFLFMAPVSIIANILGGWWSDKVRIRVVFFALMAALVTACWALTQLNSATGQWLTIICVGTSGGLFSMLLVVIWPRFFGRKHLGKISSLNMMTMTGASALGPWLFARSVDLTGSYEPAFHGCGVAALLLLATTLTMKNPSTTKAL